MAALVSILIPCYNAEPWLEETLESALGQTWPNTEIIVVDDGSTDDSLAVARSFETEGVTVIEKNSEGASAARNRALREARGEYIQFLDADDLLSPDKITVQMRRLQEEPDGTIAGAAWERFCDTPGDHEPQSKSYVAWRDFEDPFDWLVMAADGRATMPLMGWLTPRSVVEAAGSWNESLSVNDDGEYFARVLLESAKIAFCRDACVYYRSGSQKTLSARRSPQALQSWYRSLRFVEKYMLRREDSPRVRRACAHQLRHFVHSVYPNAPTLVEEAEARIEQLGEAVGAPGGSTKYNIIARVLGWKPAAWLRHLYYRLRYRHTL
ncbi:glycosyltransferase involved in cell wall biosynthesis [Salinibacter ruber]|uniref:glycosyltransferase family 2 protein n=1 Tax=Salinibacter ruber TaxID=146919 RepID=UPI002169343E|nr:glycosyltransferase family 2 protein [Salinibacter ruber]MCS3657969.1 glycosyltransferase involved in cell wall biosynthesis [Salinibacter ruber]MCS4169874.1 glycosyltransferase involved in cell wall biosynthesis [Salinibacter ruber]